MAFGNLGRSANQVLIKISGDSKELDSALKKSDSSLKGFSSNVKTYATMIGAAFAGREILRLGTDIVQAAMQVDQLTRGFSNLAASQGKDADIYLAKLKKMSHGTVSNAEIMQKANQGMLLGIDLDVLTKMMEGAAVIAQATGQEVSYIFESMVLGVARQSKLYLDNLGIIIDLDKAQQEYAKSLGITVNQLNDSQKTIAFNNAAMKGMEDRMIAVGGWSDSTASSVATLSANLADMKVAIGDELLPALNDLIVSFNDVNVAGEGLGTVIGKIIAAPLTGYTPLADQIQGATEATKLLNEAQQIGKKQGMGTIRIGDPLLLKMATREYGLQSSHLADIEDRQFNIMMNVLNVLGFQERAVELEKERLDILSKIAPGGAGPGAGPGAVDVRNLNQIELNSLRDDTLNSMLEEKALIDAMSETEYAMHLAMKDQAVMLDGVITKEEFILKLKLAQTGEIKTQMSLYKSQSFEKQALGKQYGAQLTYDPSGYRTDTQYKIYNPKYDAAKAANKSGV